MNEQPYSIYIDKRSMRIAFLVSPNVPLEVIDEIIKYNRGLWGGRFNPIIFTDGNTINEADWKLLRGVDPDIIKPLIPLHQNLLEKISRGLAPLHLEPYDARVASQEHPNVRIGYHYPISIVHNEENLRRLKQFRDDKKLAIFKLGENLEPHARLFIQRNFGFYKDEYEMPKLPSELVEEFKINNLDDLNQTLIKLSDWRAYWTYQFPGQFCSLPNKARGVKWSHNGEHFGIIIGDSPQDIAYAWNRTLAIPNWLRDRLNQLWVSPTLLQEPALKTGLLAFINNNARQQGNNNQRGLDILSLSLSQKNLEAITTDQGFAQSIHVPRFIQSLETSPSPDYGPTAETLMFLPADLELRTGRSTKEQFEIDDPDVPQGMMGGEHWMADLYIEFINDNPYISYNSTKYWQLPRRNHLLHGMFNRPARVNYKRSFSILLTRNTRDLSPGEGQIIIELPDSYSIILNLITGDYRSYYSGDPRTNIPERPYYETEISNCGQQLRGILQLFNGITPAGQYLQQRFWRQIFVMLANINSTKDEKQKARLINVLKKLGKNNPTDIFNKDIAIEKQANWIMNEIRQSANIHKGIAFKELVSLGASEQFQYELNEVSQQAKNMADINIPRQNLILLLKNLINRPLVNKKLPDPTKRNIEEELHRDLSDLLVSNILLAGVDSKCRRCGQTNWKQIENIQKKLTCDGCGYEYDFSPEPSWRYKLNTLAASAITQGVIPVILALDELQDDARNCFMYIPSLNLYTKDGGGPEAEVDIFCIQDGKFIIGEVKEHDNLFQAKDYKKMIEVAKRLMPDKVVFASLDEKPRPETIKEIQGVRDELVPFEISVEWISFPYYYFHPSFIR